MRRRDTLDLLNHLAQCDRATFTSAEAQTFLERSPQATSNTLSRMCDRGLIARVSKGVYVTSAPGMYGTSPMAADVLRTTRAAFGDVQHRVAFRSALSYHGLLTHPTRSLQVASPSRIGRRSVGDWPLDMTYEGVDTLMVGTVHDDVALSPVSTIERSLLESSKDARRVGGISVVADAIDSVDGDIDIAEVRRLASVLHARPALRRLSSIARITGHEDLAQTLIAGDTYRRAISICPGDTEAVWTDTYTLVSLPQAALDELGVG